MSAASKQRYDARREPWRKLYKTARWQRIRQQQLAERPLCERHLKRGRLVPATVVHHKVKHEGDVEIFFSGPFECLCKHCHDADAQQEERRGYSSAIGLDGWPVDERHPANAAAGEGVVRKSGPNTPGPAPQLKNAKNQINIRGI